LQLQGDFADNPMGMIPLRNAISKELDGTYVTNVALGKTISEDILSSFIDIMEREIDLFADVVRNDNNLANGFNAIGYSQGALTIRGYIEKLGSHLLGKRGLALKQLSLLLLLLLYSMSMSDTMIRQ
jgi:palmitoyl-protein thioesterase